MKGRKPTKAEQIYGQAVIQRCGCIACDKLGHPNDWPEPLEYVEFHHSSEKGAVKPLAQFFWLWPLSRSPSRRNWRQPNTRRRTSTTRSAR